MKTFKYCMALALLSASSFAADAELESTDKKLSPFVLSYVVSFPTASTATFLGNAVSYRGLGFDISEPINSTSMYWGFSFRWLYFRHNVENGTFTSGNTTATGKLYSSIDSFPITFQFKYAFPKLSETFLPYVGLGVGSTYGRRELEIGALSKNQYGWQFLMAPEVGTAIRFSSSSPLQAFFNVRYDAGFGSDAIGAISNLSLALGIGGNI